MKGNSGARLVRNASGKVFKQSNERLFEQGRRQRDFRTNVAGLSACPVVEIFSRSPDHAELVMPFIEGVCPLHCEKPMLQPLFEYFHERLQMSESSSVSGDVFIEKLESIERAILANCIVEGSGWRRSFDICKALLKQGMQDVPIGPCHGDFTFTNMLQNESGIVLFDFLDNIFDSVLFDMVKLRQDTKNRWANIVLAKPVDHAVLKRVDEAIVAELRWYECYRRYSLALLRLNLLRILPYCKTKDVAEHVLKELEP
jgi:hypothetical protein